MVKIVYRFFKTSRPSSKKCVEPGQLQIRQTSTYSDRHPVSREVLKFMFWKVPVAVWPHLWLATAQADSQNFNKHS